MTLWFDLIFHSGKTLAVGIQKLGNFRDTLYRINLGMQSTKLVYRQSVVDG